MSDRQFVVCLWSVGGSMSRVGAMWKAEGVGDSLPSGTVTFLFTDIEGSTELWEKHGEAMRSTLARHTNRRAAHPGLGTMRER